MVAGSHGIGGAITYRMERSVPRPIGELWSALIAPAEDWVGPSGFDPLPDGRLVTSDPSGFVGYRLIGVAPRPMRGHASRVRLEVTSLISSRLTAIDGGCHLVLTVLVDADRVRNVPNRAWWNDLVDRFETYVYEIARRSRIPAAHGPPTPAESSTPLYETVGSPDTCHVPVQVDSAVNLTCGSLVD